MLRKALVVLALAAPLAAAIAGCASMTHELQPHRLWRLNRGPDPARDSHFSVSDPIPALEGRGWTR